MIAERRLLELKSEIAQLTAVSAATTDRAAATEFKRRKAVLDCEVSWLRQWLKTANVRVHRHAVDTVDSLYHLCRRMIADWASLSADDRRVMDNAQAYLRAHRRLD